MTRPLPDYYSSLRPFAGAFATGNPILTYHKLGPRPGRVRLKGLYLGTRLFTRQLHELKQAGYTSGALKHCAGLRNPGKIVITFDDGCLNVLSHGLAPLADTGFRAVQFIVADLLGKTNEWDLAVGEAQEQLMDPAQVREWLAAGHDLGSHTMSHPWLTRLSPQQAKAEIRDSKHKLEDLFSRPIQHFCYPYGDWNEGVRDLVIEAGYKTACTTEAGVNTLDTSPFSLKRFTARYPSRSLRALWRRLRG